MKQNSLPILSHCGRRHGYDVGDAEGRTGGFVEPYDELEEVDIGLRGAKGRGMETMD